MASNTGAFLQSIQPAPVTMLNNSSEPQTSQPCSAESSPPFSLPSSPPFSAPPQPFMIPTSPPFSTPFSPPFSAPSSPPFSAPPQPFMIPHTMLSVPVYGVISPSIVIFTIVTNTLVCVVLLKRTMRSSPTNLFLAAMAVSDMLTGVWPLPCFVYFYTLGYYADYVPYRMCFAYHCLTEYLPIVFHTASIWLTVGLAFQRYISVCQPIVAKTWCTVENAVWTVVVVYTVAFLSQICRFLENKYEPLPVTSKLDDNVTTVGCRQEYVAFIVDNMNAYFNVYYWIRVIFIHLVPCSVLIILNALLIQTMRTAQKHRLQLLKQNQGRSECRRLAESNLTTLMLVVVVGVFLVVEFPLALLLIILIVDNSFDLDLLDDDARWIAPMLINLFILLSYPLNFFIYCGMSRQFRVIFEGLICCRSSPNVRVIASEQLNTFKKGTDVDRTGYTMETNPGRTGYTIETNPGRTGYTMETNPGRTGYTVETNPGVGTGDRNETEQELEGGISGEASQQKGISETNPDQKENPDRKEMTDQMRY